MDYEYSGYLAHLLYAPDIGEAAKQPAVEFTAADFAKWHTRDVEWDREWQNIPVTREVSEDSVVLAGRFNDVRAIDNLAQDDPSVWVPLSTIGVADARLPVNLLEYPMLEVCYRCNSENAFPHLLWLYPGGQNLVRLPCTRRWRTIVRRVSLFGFPESIEHLVVRLYASARTPESLELRSIRFRAMTPAEAEACEKDAARLDAVRPVHTPLLDTFMPLGTFVRAATARRLAEHLGISLSEYWGFVLEDLVRHSHNTLGIEEVGQLTDSEWADLTGQCEAAAIRILGIEHLDPRVDQERLHELVAHRVHPSAESNAVLGWSVRIEPGEEEFEWLIQARQQVEEAAPAHPLVTITRHPSGTPLFGRGLAAVGINHYPSHAPGNVGRIVSAHIGALRAQQLWMVGPGFTYATGTPEWSTCPEMRLMVNLAFANGARGWFTYTYHNDPIWSGGSVQRSLTGPFLAFSDLWLELDKRMERYNALAPLLLSSTPAPVPPDGLAGSLAASSETSDSSQPNPVGIYRLRGPDFNLYFLVSSNVRGMSSLNLHIPPHSVAGLELFDLFDFVRSHTWAPMDLDRHFEMFPGQARIILCAEPDVCALWRDEIAKRLASHTQRQMAYARRLAENHGLDLDEVDTLWERLEQGAPMERLLRTDKCRDLLIDIVYGTPFISDTRSQLIGALSALCACDGVLCRLVRVGRVEQANEWSPKVIPLAREVTQMRLELARGGGLGLASSAGSLKHRVLALLSELRALA